MIKYSDWEFYLVNQSYPNGNGSIYLWGGQGEDRAKLTDEYIKKKETSTANAKRVIALRDKRVKEGYKNLKAYDCSGLGVAYFIEKGELKSDTTAHGLYTKSTKKTRSELKAGDCVFRMYTSGSNEGHVYHVGYVISENKISFHNNHGSFLRLNSCFFSISSMSSKLDFRLFSVIFFSRSS